MAIHDDPAEHVAKNWSGKRGSNSRPQPWQGCALPAELFPRFDSVSVFGALSTPLPSLIASLRLEHHFKVLPHRPESQYDRKPEANKSKNEEQITVALVHTP